MRYAHGSSVHNKMKPKKKLHECILGAIWMRCMKQKRRVCGVICGDDISVAPVVLADVTGQTVLLASDGVGDSCMLSLETAIEITKRIRRRRKRQPSSDRGSVITPTAALYIRSINKRLGLGQQLFSSPRVVTWQDCWPALKSGSAFAYQNTESSMVRIWCQKCSICMPGNMVAGCCC